MNPAGTSHSEAQVPLTTAMIRSGSPSLGGRHDFIRRDPYSLRTLSAFLESAKRYILFHGQRYRPRNGGVGNNMKPWPVSCCLTRCFSRLEMRNSVARSGLWVPTFRFLNIGSGNYI